MFLCEVVEKGAILEAIDHRGAEIGFEYKDGASRRARRG